MKCVQSAAMGAGLPQEHKQDLPQEAAVLLPEGEEDEQKELARLGIDLSDHPEVQEVDLVVPPHQVPGVGIGVEEAVNENLAVVGLQQLASSLLSRLTLRRLPHGNPLHLLHDQ